MTDVPAALRSRLAERIPFSTLEVEHEARSRDGTVKTLFRTGDGVPVEAVLMRFRDGRRSVCLSSQSGCPLTCTFCATGQMRFRRNLTASEMLDQALHFRRLEAIDHVRSEEHTSELQSLAYLVCRLLLEKKKSQPSRAFRSRDRRQSSRLSRTPGGCVRTAASSSIPALRDAWTRPTYL